MRGQKKVRRLQGCGVAGLLLLLGQAAHGQSFSEGKNLHEIRETVRDLTTPSRLTASLPKIRIIGQTNRSRQTNELSPIFLPRWSAECLPFFCRIEHDFAQKSIVPVKFRLGSVEYVDWLEGKGDYIPR